MSREPVSPAPNTTDAESSPFETLLAHEPSAGPPTEKARLMLAGLNSLTRRHYEACPDYARILDARWGGPVEAACLAEVPWLPVGLFKALSLASTQRPNMTLASSGTTGQRPSRIAVDAETADRQARALVATFRPALGASRQPLLLIDTDQVIRDPATLTARGAGVLGMMKLGARPTFALGPDLAPDRERIRDFVARCRGRPFFLFGFTFLVWTKLYEAFADGELDLSDAALVHSGGWKTLEDRKVSNAEFRASLARRFGLTRVFNFYGFVEQIGSIFLEGAPGLLSPPNFTEVIIRDPVTWEALPPGREGVIQTLSLLPLSYPGHSVLTEDWGVIETADGADGRPGSSLRILGRVPKAELRGCSDVLGAAA